MKITKYNHSCLLIEENGTVVLIDPGMYSKDVLPTKDLKNLDYILITHEHQDHFDIELVKKLFEKFPKVKIIATPSIVEILAKENITAASEGDKNIKVEAVPHEKVFAFPVPQNIMVTVFDKLSHPGDSHSFKTNAKILALPVAAPWGSTTRAVELAEELNPSFIIPIHDFMLKETFRKTSYQWMQNYFKPKGIDFKAIETGETIEI